MRRLLHSGIPALAVRLRAAPLVKGNVGVLRRMNTSHLGALGAPSSPSEAKAPEARFFKRHASQQQQSPARSAPVSAPARVVKGRSHAEILEEASSWGMDEEGLSQVREQLQFSDPSAVEPSFENALRALNTLQSNANALQRRVSELKNSPFSHSDAQLVAARHEEVLDCLRRIGLDHDTLVQHLRGRIIHVAGTKGKGSTCALTESILRRCGAKTGMFTSPHLVDIRERIRIGGEPISVDEFSEHFWRVWHMLFATRHEGCLHMPMYFRFLTILALDIFVRTNVDVVLFEAGVGGRGDSTNVVPPEVLSATAITSLGFDHMNVLGSTLPEIAGEKGGIYKVGVPAFTVPQRSDAMSVLVACSQRVGEQLTVVAVDDTVPDSLHQSEKDDPLPARSRPLAALSRDVVPEFGLEGEHQFINGSLALCLASHWLHGAPGRIPADMDVPTVAELLGGVKHLPAPFIDALKYCRWPGRSQNITLQFSDRQPAQPPLARVELHLDGAHTPESTEACALWFASKAGRDDRVVLVFNCANSRAPSTLLAPLLTHNDLTFDACFFTSNLTGEESVLVDRRPGAYASKDCRPWHERCADDARAILATQPTLKTVVESFADVPSVYSKLEGMAAESPERPIHVLVTGSLFLVGAWLQYLKVPVQ